MKQRVITSIRENNLWCPGDQVAIGVSGGPDSIALCGVLAATQGLHRGKLSMVTVHHNQHSDADLWVELVQDVARALHLPCEVHRVSLAPGASEAAARAARYAVFQQVSADRIALAHHQQDQAETVLINLLRGTGLRGLGAMSPRRGRFVRPLLDISKETVHSYLRSTGLPSCDDPANEAERFLRVRVRTSLLPLLTEIRGGVVGSITRTARHIRDDVAALDQLAAALPLTRTALLSAPIALRRRRIQQALQPVELRTVDAVLRQLDRGDGSVWVRGKGEVVICGDQVEIPVQGQAIEPFLSD